MKKILRKTHAAALVLCYSIGVCIWLLGGVCAFAGETLDRAAAGRGEYGLQPRQFDLLEIEPDGPGALRTRSEDPQMHLELGGQKLTGLRYTASFEREPRKMCLYYTTAPGADFDELKCVEPKAGPDGSFTYWLPPGKTFYSLRLDPASAAGIRVEMSEVRLDMARPVWRYFALNGQGALLLGLAPGLVAAALRALGQLVQKQQEEDD